jgi:hypothetical protein
MALLVALLTPADASSPSYTAFQDELCNNLGWPQTTLVAYPIKNFASIQAAAKQAHDDVKTNGGVLVAAGEMAASFLQDQTPTTDNIPIVLAYAGQAPSNADKNMTGYVGDCVGLAKGHLKKLKVDAGLATSVMYDPDLNNDATQNALQQLDGYTPLPISPADLQNGIVTAATLTQQLHTNGFMMIPNAVYYKYVNLIATAVDNANPVTLAYYPEIEYQRQSTKKGKTKVSGYNVLLTYRLAACWVDNLLTGVWTVGTMPLPGKFEGAISYPYS